jgi:hypothetical protein
MPNAFVTNQRINTYGGALSALVEMLVSAGWSYKASGDGLSGYSSTGKIFTGTGAGALGWGNNRAWARVQDPGARREICIQRDATNGTRIKLSASAKFVGGSPSATVVPSATDERVIWGSGTDASPTGTAYYDTNMLLKDLWIWQGAAFGSAPYGFWFGGQAGPTNLTKTGFLMMDPVVGPAEDPDPVVWQVGTNFPCVASTSSIGRDAAAAATWTTGVGPGNQGCFAHLDTAMSAAGFVFVQPASYSHGSVGLNPADFAPGGAGNNYLGNNPFNAGLDVLPIMYCRQRYSGSLLPWGVKGWSTLAMWTGRARQSFFDTLDDRRWICFGHMWLRWDGATDPVGG